MRETLPDRCFMADDHKYRSWVEVDLNHYRHNWSEIRRLIGPRVAIMPAVKADAYGHGAIEISRIALQCGASCLGVANADEGVQLRAGGIDAPVVILSPATVSEIREIIKHNLIPSISDLTFAREYDKELRAAEIRMPVHIEVDTGMGRGGLIYSEALQTIRRIAELPHLILRGIFTHFSSSEVADDDHNRIQWERFNRTLDELHEAGIEIPIKHMSNSGGVMNYPHCHFDLVRPGIMTYGIFPAKSPSPGIDILPVMSFKTSVVLVKEFPKDYGIGYNRTFITSCPTRIATIPVGYGDGFGVILSNRGEALIRGRRAPVVGRVSMDMCTIDVTHIPECGVGDEVVLLGRQGAEYISANEIAGRAGTISYEVLCALGKRAPRVFLDKGRADTVEPRLRRVFIPDEEKSIARIDNIIRRCFQARANDEELGNAIYYEMFETLFGKEDRRLELRTRFKYDIRVQEFSKGEIKEDPTVEGSFRIKTRVEYTKVLRSSFFLIGCAMNNEQLAALFREEFCEYRWLLGRTEDPFRERDFKIEAVRVDGDSVPIIRAEQTARGYEVWCGGSVLQGKVDRPVKVELEIVTRKPRNSNIFSVFIVYPTRGLEISFDYGDAGLKNVREVSFFSGKCPNPEVVRDKNRSIVLKMKDDEWVFPNSGTTFIWDL